MSNLTLAIVIIFAPVILYAFFFILGLLVTPFYIINEIAKEGDRMKEKQGWQSSTKKHNPYGFKVE